MRILIADDDQLMLKTLEFRLKRDGHEVFLSRDGQEAMEMINTQDLDLDLVISDIMMPYSSGLELIGFIKQRFNNTIRTIILSGMGQENVILEAFRLGAADFITKPFSPNELSMRINRLKMSN
ncbi:MAG: response regulator transcription factor [Oligoflexus sp.]|nr:response regulator transcription factor [Pseudopedobacter sp.]